MWGAYSMRISIFSLCTEWEALEKSTKCKAVCRCVALMPSIVRQTFRICPTVDLFFKNHFGFYGATFLLRVVFCWEALNCNFFFCSWGECDSSIVFIFFTDLRSLFGKGSMQISLHRSLTSPLYVALQNWSRF